MCSVRAVYRIVCIMYSAGKDTDHYTIRGLQPLLWRSLCGPFYIKPVLMPTFKLDTPVKADAGIDFSYKAGNAQFLLSI